MKLAIKDKIIQKKHNKTHIRFLAASTVLLGLIAFGIYTMYSKQYVKALTIAQVQKEQLVVHQLKQLVGLGFTDQQNATKRESINRVVSNSGIIFLTVTDNKGDTFVELGRNDVSNDLSDDTEKQEKDPTASSTFQYKETVIVNDSNIYYMDCKFSRSNLEAKIQESQRDIALITILLFVLSVIGLFGTSLIIMIPLQNVSKSISEITAGNLTKKIEQKKPNEFSKITSSVNILADNLHKANTQIEKLNKELKFQFRDKIGELNHEINQRRQAEYSLKQSEEQFKLLFELAPIGMVISNVHGKILKVNVAFHTILGYTEKEIIGSKIKDLTFAEDQELDIRIHDKLVNDLLQHAYYEKRLVRKDGEIIYVIVEAVLVKNKSDNPSHIIEQIIDITERKKVERELVFAKEKAEESDRLKSAFLAQMSHEIRTPLNVILTAMELIGDDLNNADEETKMMLESVSSAGIRLQRTINLILDISAVQSGSYAHDIKDFDLGIELQSLVDEFSTVKNEKKLKMAFINKASSSLIIADHYSVTQIFQNLIDNALKYTIKGSVDVILEDLNDDKLQVHVKDSGIGISKEYLENLFSPFSQEDVGQKREFEGNGLGLALVKRYVELNHAEIFVESEKGKGTTFTVVFNKNLENLDNSEDNHSLKHNNIRALA
jgi:PAS domain S-box-containing protein